MGASRYLAFDLGAESGRALLGSIEAGALSLDELHRFPNEPVEADGELHWDILRLWNQVQRGLAAAHERGFDALDGIGVDAWGVDFALLGEGGTLLQNPFHYRDARTDGVPERVFNIVSAEEMYAATGIQFLQINSIFQLFAAAQRSPKLLSAAETLLTIPDLFNYWLSGKAVCEFTNATTTQMYNPLARDWEKPMLERLGLSARILPRVVQPGEVLGSLRREILRRSGLLSAQVVAPACHDTGSAVAAIASSGRTAFISSGTWSLLGAEITAPVITEQARKLNFTNEGGVCGTTRLLKNIMGMWLLQSCRKRWQSQGVEHDYATLIGVVSPKPVLESLIDPDHPSCLHPEDMTQAIADFCTQTEQKAPSNATAFVQTIFESLALKYRYVLEALESLTGVRYDEIRIVGGGARNRVLNQFTADATGRCVAAGPVEATALGNIAMQMVATGAVSRLAEARAIIERSFPVTVFEPQNPSPWDSAYPRFRQYCGRALPL